MQSTKAHAAGSTSLNVKLIAERLFCFCVKQKWRRFNQFQRRGNSRSRSLENLPHPGDGVWTFFSQKHLIYIDFTSLGRFDKVGNANFLCLEGEHELPSQPSGWNSTLHSDLSTSSTNLWLTGSWLLWLMERKDKQTLFTTSSQLEHFIFCGKNN